jgi:hypothetical protein
MRRKYLLADKEFWIEVIGFSELRFSPIYATQISAIGLKRFLRTCPYNEVFITSTLPNVYVQAGNCLFRISYRPFLGFVSHLYEVEEFISLNWRTDGF